VIKEFAGMGRAERINFNIKIGGWAVYYGFCYFPLADTIYISNRRLSVPAIIKRLLHEIMHQVLYKEHGLDVSQRYDNIRDIEGAVA